MSSIFITGQNKYDQETFNKIKELRQLGYKINHPWIKPLKNKPVIVTVFGCIKQCDQIILLFADKIEDINYTEALKHLNFTLGADKPIFVLLPGDKKESVMQNVNFSALQYSGINFVDSWQELLTKLCLD